MKKTYNIIPCPKPRQTQRDKWLRPPRPVVAKYRAFKDEVRYFNVLLPTARANVTFCIPIPKSWSKAKKDNYIGKPHQQTPDLDNLLKALGDAIYMKDEIIWKI